MTAIPASEIEQYLFSVQDSFDLTGRGLVVVSQPNCLHKVERWTQKEVLLKRPDGTTLRKVALLDMPSPNENQIAAMSFPGLSKKEVPLGTEIYLPVKWRSNLVALRKPELSKQRLSRFTGVRAKLENLGLIAAKAITLLPRNFEAPPDEFVFEMSTSLVAKLWAKNNIQGQKIELRSVSPRKFVEARSDVWESPTLFFPLNIQQTSPQECSRSIIVICNYLQEKYSQENLLVRIQGILEQEEGNCTSVSVEGTTSEVIHWALGLFKVLDS